MDSSDVNFKDSSLMLLTKMPPQFAKKTWKRNVKIREWRNKTNKIGFTILSFFCKKLCNKQHFRQQAWKHTKTLTNSRQTYEQVVPLETTLHKESSKIWFDIFRAVHK